ncbi:cell envelope integrity protein TolA [Endozoicomonas ascidiicola]|uniref:cell envelope integrity protein TolA n=1 Tax=Endozoicomonas ascidiicola TaxID=1698521 RepID=UPI0008300718|nr:cell envelope integrity protein TolA [Endozoicomonas ascidiicola]
MKGRFRSLFSGTFSGGRESESYIFAIALSVILHALMVILLTISWHTESKPKFTPPMPISAALVELPKATPKPVRAPDNTKQKAAEQKRIADARKKADAKRKAEARKKAEQERQKAIALKREQEKKKAAADEKALAEKRRREEEQRRFEQQQAALEQALAAEARAQQEAQQLEHDQLEQARYVALIRQLASQYWNRPPSARNGMVAEVRINLSPFGDVLDISMMTSSGNEEYDRSVIQALRRASPFSELKNLERRLFDQYFRQITFRFSPEDLVR